MKELIEGKEEKELEKLEVSCAAPAVGRNIRENWLKRTIVYTNYPMDQ